MFFKGLEYCKDKHVLNALSKLSGANCNVPLSNIQIQRLVEVHRVEWGEKQVELVGIGIRIKSELPERIPFDGGLYAGEHFSTKQLHRVVEQSSKLFGTFNTYNVSLR